MYLIVNEESISDFYTKQDINASEKKLAKNGELLIIDLETKEFYVENDIWQKIPER